MNEKPEALRLADALDAAAFPFRGCLEALSATELRHLHEENERLREALQGIAEIDFRNVDSIWARLLLREVVDKAIAALRREDV